jgi:hypothetical protein
VAGTEERLFERSEPLGFRTGRVAGDERRLVYVGRNLGRRCSRKDKAANQHAVFDGEDTADEIAVGIASCSPSRTNERSVPSHSLF